MLLLKKKLTEGIKSMLGKRIIETGTIKKIPVTVCGQELSNIHIIGEDGEVVLKMEVGLESQTPTALCYYQKKDDEMMEYIPYTINTRGSLDSYSCSHIVKLLGNMLYYNTGLTIDIVGLYYDDKVLNCGILEGNRIMTTEGVRVRKIPINLS